ncbi:MAG: hypothetical protein WC028_17755 [Candidatus Obscuribacterales bacterium]
MVQLLSRRAFTSTLTLPIFVLSSGLAPSAFALSENLKDPSGFLKIEIKSKAGDERQAVSLEASAPDGLRAVPVVNLLAREYSIHPVLGTKAGEHFKGDLASLDFDKLCCWESWNEEVPYDPNYLFHEVAEMDAAEGLCRLALAGKFNTYRPTNLDPGYERVARLTVGFNQIPLELTYRGFDCTKAECGATVQREYKRDLPKTGPYRPAILKHSVLDTDEFSPLGAISLSDQKFKELNDDPGATDFFENQYIYASKCFRKAEAGAALQFRDRVIGLSDVEILKVAGEPSVKIASGIVLSDSDKYKNNWVYYFGHSGIPVRIVFEGNKCVGSAVLSSAQNYELVDWNHRRFAPGLPSSPEGKSRAEALALYGEPQTIAKDAAGHPVYIYGVGRFTHVEMPIVNDHVYGRISYAVRCGWTRRKSAMAQ